MSSLSTPDHADSDALTCEETTENAEVVLRWEGTDAGRYPMRKLVVLQGVRA